MRRQQLLVLAAQVTRTGSRRKIAGAAALIAVFLMGPLLLFPVNGGREMRWFWWQNLIGDAYMLVTLSFIAWAALFRRSAVTAEPPVASAPSTAARRVLVRSVS